MDNIFTWNRCIRATCACTGAYNKRCSDHYTLCHYGWRWRINCSVNLRQRQQRNFSYLAILMENLLSPIIFHGIFRLVKNVLNLQILLRNFHVKTKLFFISININIKVKMGKCVLGYFKFAKFGAIM